jgi:uncharacterized protein (TIGR00106 family)
MTAARSLAGERMIAEFSVAPVGVGVSMSQHVARCLTIVEESGLDYRLTAMGTILEGDWDEVMRVIQRCHSAVLEDAPRVLTTIRIDDRKGARDVLERKVSNVERIVGHQLKK